MRELFPFRISEQALFCRTCMALSPHGVYAREAYSVCGGLMPKIPLLCVCDKCSTYYLAFSQEFAFAAGAHGDLNYAKIPGKNRLFAGNWVYVEGMPRPGRLKRIVRSGEVRSLLIDYGIGEEQAVEIREAEPIEAEEAPKGYRLLPAQSGETLVGDFVYHVRRKMFGRAIGLVNDNDEDKLVVQLASGMILFLTLPESYQSLPDSRLQKEAEYKIERLPLDLLQRISLRAQHGVLNVAGTVRSLAERRKILAVLDSIPSIRGTLSQIRIEPDCKVEDGVLENAIHKTFEDSPNSDFAYYKVKVEGGKATVVLGYYKEAAVRHFEAELEKIEGILELSLLPECVAEPSADELRRLRDAESKIKSFTADKAAKVHLSVAEGKLIVSGFANTQFLRNRIRIQLFKSAWKLTSIQNNLRVAAREEA